MPELGWEGRRQAYLAAIGIPLWTARYPLAHAAVTESIAVAALGYEEYGGARVGSAGDDDELPDSPLAETREDAGGGGSAVLSDEGGPLNDGPPLDAYLEDPEILDALARGAAIGQGAVATSAGTYTQRKLPTRSLPSGCRRAPGGGGLTACSLPVRPVSLWAARTHHSPISDHQPQ